MRVTRLRAAGWRNLEETEVLFSEGAKLQVLFGDNAQGKTNLLEAIFYLSAFRSFRTSKGADLVRHDASAAHISAEIVGRDLTRSVETRLARIASDARAAVSRTIRVDEKAISSTTKAFGLLSTVLFVPEDLTLLRAPPSARRRFLDFAVSGADRAYFAEASELANVLRQRNALLRRFDRSSGSTATMLDVYDEQLSVAGARVVERRRALVRALEPRVRQFFGALHDQLHVALVYRSDPLVQDAESPVEIARAMARGIAAGRATDLRRGYTTFGPHLDDLELELDHRLAREHASQGQLRSLVLAMKLAELANVEAATGETPVLLLDDVPSELDPGRRRHLFEALAALNGQTFLTVADRAVVPPTSRARAEFHVAAGRVEPA